jgi:Flp pilus assembly protein TadD/predicted aspartyl protease
MQRLLLALAVAAALPFVAGAARSSPDELELQLKRGDELFAAGRYLEALAAYQQARHTDDKDLRLRAARGTLRSLLRTTEFSRVRDEGQALREAAPSDADAVALHGDALWMNGLFEEAEQAYRDALVLDPHLARGRHGLARSLAGHNDLDGAETEAQTAVGLAPDEREYHHTLSMIYERMNRYADASESLNRFLQLVPKKDSSGSAILARETLRFMRSFRNKKPLHVQGDGDHVVHVLPFRLVRDKIVVQGRINGGHTYEFVVDTGAEQTVLSRPTAQREGILPIAFTLAAGVGHAGLRGLAVGRVEQLQFGTLKVKHVPCLIKPIARDAPPGVNGESFSPLALGMSLSIDYGRRVMTMARELPETPADIEMPLWMQRLAVVRGIVNGSHHSSFIVDTGGEAISINRSTANAVTVVPTRRIPLKVYGSSGWDPDAFLLPGVNLEFDDVRFQNFPVVVLNLQAPSALLGFNVGGIVGHRFLSKYRVTIDLERSALRLKHL